MARVGSRESQLLFFFGPQKLTGNQRRTAKREANIRFGLIRVREQAELHCLLARGQSLEQAADARTAFRDGAEFRSAFIRWELGLDFFQNGYQYHHLICPA